MNLRPDPTFHATPKLAMQAPVERYAFTVMLSPDGSQSDGIAVIDLDTKSDTYGQIVHQVIVPHKGDDSDPAAVLADDSACDVGARNPAGRGPAGDWPRGLSAVQS